MEESTEQVNNSKIPPQLLPHVYKKGQSGNPGGRPAGKTLKQYTREKLAAMTDDEREEFLNGIDKRTIWEMGEDKAGQGADIKLEVVSKVIKLDIE